MPQFDKRACRPRDHLVVAGKLYPEAWRQADAFRADRGRDGLPDWPDWCYLPMAGWYAIVSGGGESRVPLHMIGDVGRLAALGTWRATQGIYRFDPTLYEAIVSTPVTNDLPHEVLYRLPEWGVYIETPNMTANGSPMHGFFAHLEWDAGNGRPELRLLLDTDAALLPIPIHLGPWSLDESLARMTDVASLHSMSMGLGPSPADTVDQLRPWVEPLISLLLYLCSQNAEIGDGSRVPKKPEPKRTKRGWRMFPADRPTTWDVGVRIGSALRRAYRARASGESGTHAGPLPHVRRAHWHGFWRGPRKDPAARAFELRWLPPIPVNVTDIEDLPATIRPVRGETKAHGDGEED